MFKLYLNTWNLRGIFSRYFTIYPHAAISLLGYKYLDTKLTSTAVRR